MAGVSLSGMSSGLDTESIVKQLMAVESQGKNRLIRTEKLAIGRKTAMEDVARQLRALQAAISDLRSTTTWTDVQGVTSSDQTKAGARVIGPAPPGTISVRIDQLARAEQRTYDTAAIPKGPVLLDGVAVDLTGTTTPEEIAAKINAAGGTPFAGVVGGSLVLTGRTLGKAIDFKDAGTSTAIATTRTDAAQPTLYSINGGPVISTTDSVVKPGSLPGVELTLKDVGTTTLSITVPGVDAEKIKAKVKAFTDAYNATVDLVRGKLAEQKVKNPTTTADFTKGALRGDTALTGLLTNLRGLVQGPADTTTTIDSLAELGVAVPRPSTTGTPSPEALAGKLVFDGDKLAAALAASPADVRKLLGATSATTGAVMSDIGAAIEPIGKAATGYLARSAAAADSEASRMRARQEDVDRNLKLKEARLRSQFTALETALNQSSSQAGWIQGQISGLPSWR